MASAGQKSPSPIQSHFVRRFHTAMSSTIRTFWAREQKYLAAEQRLTLQAAEVETGFWKSIRISALLCNTNSLFMSSPNSLLYLEVQDT